MGFPLRSATIYLDAGAAGASYFARLRRPRAVAGRAAGPKPPQRSKGDQAVERLLRRFAGEAEHRSHPAVRHLPLLRGDVHHGGLVRRQRSLVRDPRDDLVRLHPLRLLQGVEEGEQPMGDVGTRQVPARLASAKSEVILVPAGVDRRVEGAVRQVVMAAPEEQEVREKTAHPPVAVREGPDGEELQEVRRDDEQGVELPSLQARGEPSGKGLHLRRDQERAGGAKGDRVRQEVPVAPSPKSRRLVSSRAAPLFGEMPEHRRVQCEEVAFRRGHVGVAVEDRPQGVGVPGRRPRPAVPRDPA